MKKLNSSARTTEVDSVSDQIVLLYGNSALADDTFLKGIVDEISVESDKITDAINCDRVYSDMEEVDVTVEKDARALKTIVKGYAAMPDEKLSAAAKEVLDVINKFNFKMFRLSLEQQSSNVEALLMDLDADNIKPQSALLPSVPETIEKLRQSQKNFVEKYNAYIKAYTSNADMLTASKIRRTLTSLINGKLNIYLSSAVMMNPDKYGTFVAEIEKAIEGVNQDVRMRETAAKKKKESQ